MQRRKNCLSSNGHAKELNKLKLMTMVANSKDLEERQAEWCDADCCSHE